MPHPHKHSHLTTHPLLFLSGVQDALLGAGGAMPSDARRHGHGTAGLHRGQQAHGPTPREELGECKAGAGEGDGTVEAEDGSSVGSQP